MVQRRQIIEQNSTDQKRTESNQTEQNRTMITRVRTRIEGELE